MDSVTNHEVMKQILKDSFGGILYDVANRNKYDTTELLAIWDSLPAYEKENAGGIITGAINFIRS